MTDLSHALPLDEFHRILDILQSIDVGLVVLDRNCHVTLWNGFMENYSGFTLKQLEGKTLFQCFPTGMDATWLRQKIETTFTLRTTSFISWELRPYLFQFQPNRPFTGLSDFMYQNVTIMPLISRHGDISHACLIIYDVTDVATSKLALQSANEQLTLLSITDKLTTTYNRGYWEEALSNEFKRFHRNQKKSSLLMLDIDHFKKINDTYGHPAGDEVLRVMSRLLKQTVRGSDIVGRYGGEEFGIILYEVDETAAAYVAERIRRLVAEQTVVYGDHSIQFTISCGAAEVSSNDEQAIDWLKRADSALYYSKHHGRNQVTSFKKIPS